MARAAQVTALVFEAMANNVCSSTAAPPMARTPYPRVNTACPSFTTATDTAG